MLINVNAYSVEYNVIGDTPSGYTVPSTVTGVGYGETVTLAAAQIAFLGKRMALTVHGNFPAGRQTETI